MQDKDTRDQLALRIITEILLILLRKNFKKS